MRLVLQRVSSASVSVGGDVVGQIRRGVLALVAAGHDDDERVADKAATKVAGLRIFPDAQGRMNRSVQDVEGAVLVVSQFTLLGDASKGRRPSFVAAADPAVAEPLVKRVAGRLTGMGLQVAEGRFGADMQVELVNDGPVTLVLDI